MEYNISAASISRPTMHEGTQRKQSHVHPTAPNCPIRQSVNIGCFPKKFPSRYLVPAFFVDACLPTCTYPGRETGLASCSCSCSCKLLGVECMQVTALRPRPDPTTSSPRYVLDRSPPNWCHAIHDTPIKALFVYSLEGRDWSGLRPNHGFSARRVIFSSPQKFGLRLHPVWNISPAHPVHLFSFGLDKFSPQQTRGKISTTRTRERMAGEYSDNCGSKADPGG
jgi:hypothetical protein